MNRTLLLLFPAFFLCACLRFRDGDALFHRGVAAFEAGDYRNARALFSKALKSGLVTVPPEEVQTCLGSALEKSGELNNALIAHRKALNINPGFQKAWINMGIAYRKLGHLDEAERCYRKAGELAPASAELLSSLGVLYLARGEAERAVDILERAVAKSPGWSVPYANLALAYALVGRFDDAGRSLEKAAGLGCENVEKIRDRIRRIRSARKAGSHSG